MRTTWLVGALARASPRSARALEREYLRERLDPRTRAYTDADNHARRWTSFHGGFG
jgi:hypothetical protein